MFIERLLRQIESIRTGIMGQDRREDVSADGAIRGAPEASTEPGTREGVGMTQICK